MDRETDGGTDRVQQERSLSQAENSVLPFGASISSSLAARWRLLQTNATAVAVYRTRKCYNFSRERETT